MGYKPAKKKPAKGSIVDPSAYYQPSLNANYSAHFSTLFAGLGATISGSAGIATAFGGPGWDTLMLGGVTAVFAILGGAGDKGPMDKVKVADLFTDDDAVVIVDAVSKMKDGELNLIMHDLWHYVHYAKSRGFIDVKNLRENKWAHLFAVSKQGEPKELRGYLGEAPSGNFEKVHSVLNKLAPRVRWPSQAVELAWVNGHPVWTLASGLRIYGSVVKAEGHRVPAPYSINLASATVSKHMEQLEELDKTAIRTDAISSGITVEFRAYEARPAVIPPTVRYDIKAAENRYGKIKKAWTEITTDSLNALTHSALFSYDDPITDSFAKAFFRLEDALEHAKAGDVEAREDLADYAIEAETKWNAALLSAERKSYGWLPPEQAEAGRLAEKLLVLANDKEAKPGERATAARKAADLLDVITAITFPKESSDKLALMGSKPKELTV